MTRRLPHVALAAAATLVLIGCAAPDAGQRITAPAVATFEVADTESYRILLETQEHVDHVVELMNGGEDGRIPNGRIVRDGDGGVNAPWSWHIDPSSLEFVDVTTEVCDGLPEYVEDGTLTSDWFCPWLTEVTALESYER